jgi:uncharacterized glyoxalase superfamily protein PhnB
MILDENISKIIANYVLGNITEEESSVLKDWLSDPYNELLFKKIIDEENLASELLELDAVDSNKTYQQFKAKTSTGINFKKILAYAAAIAIPIALGVMAVYFGSESLFEQELANNIEFDKDKITILTEDGEQHKFTGNDTLANISNAQLKVEGENISFRASVEKKSVKPIYNTINIPAGKKYKLKLSDGSVVHLNSETTLRYPIDFVGKKRSVQLVSGEAFFEVEKSEKPFVLDFGSSKIRVLGTKFNVKSYNSEEQEQVTLEEGSIALNNSKDEVQLLPNQQATINKSNLSMKIDVVDASIYSSWRNGFLNYREEKLSTILSDLQRQYNVKVFYQNQDVKNKRLSISINTNKEITRIFKAIEATGDVKFEVNNSNVIVTKK